MKDEGANFVNCYADASRAGAYATLEFANTYYLAYRDLPAILVRACNRNEERLTSVVAPAGQRGSCGNSDSM